MLISGNWRVTCPNCYKEWEEIDRTLSTSVRYAKRPTYEESIRMQNEVYKRENLTEDKWNRRHGHVAD